MSPGERQRAALRAVLAAGMLVVGFALFGEVVLDYLGVSVESLSIAGGLLLLLVALEMLRGIDSAPGEDGDVALVPLATPLVAGPGAIATVIVLARQHPEPGGGPQSSPGSWPRCWCSRRASCWPSASRGSCRRHCCISSAGSSGY
jgi:small neutral amino acid transporter SnatA (MarC family)